MNFQLEIKKLADMQPADYNPREIRQEALTGLQGSISRFGMLVPIVWNKRSGRIVGGHQRYKVLTSQGVEEVEVVVVDLDDNEEVALNITLNNPSTRGTFTKSVVGLLQETERHMAEEFKEVGLGDMLNYLSRYKFEGMPEKKKTTSSKGSSTPSERVKEGMRCPRCRSVWRKDNGDVVVRSGVKNG
jgi:hypothetical protein